MGNGNLRTNKFLGWCREVWHSHANRHRKLIIAGVVIAAVSIGVVQITAADYDTDNYEILAGTMDMNWGFTVTPVKVLVTMEGRGSIVTVTIANSEDVAKQFAIRQEEAWKVTEGLQPWDGKMTLRFPEAITVDAHSDFAFDVVIDKGRATYGQEAWLMIAQVSDNVIQHEVAVRLLIELN